MVRRLTGIAVLSVVIIFLSVAKDPQGKKVQKVSGSPNATLININNISSWYESNGKGEQNPYTGNSGLSFPRGTDYAIFTSGLMFGAISDDGISTGPRVVGSSYNTGFTAGAILGIRTGATEDPSNSDVRIWRVRKDYAVADLKQDAAEYYGKSISGVTEQDISLLREQYRKDWEQWPWQKGAPFYDTGYWNASNSKVNANNGVLDWGEDVNKNGVLDSGEDLNGNNILDSEFPGLANADQVIWFVANDIRNGDSPWKTKPLGLELQTTIWAYKSDGVPGNIIYKKYKMIYKGVNGIPENSTLTNSYLTHWSDPDLGDYGDDYAGCDTILSLGYVYNSKTLDANYRKYNIAPPAIGYDFLQGPMVQGTANDTAVFDLKKRVGYKNLPMTSFIYFAAAGRYPDPPFTLSGSLQWYCMMKGHPPTPIISDCAPLEINPINGQPTKFWLSGDPVTRTGWIDGKGLDGKGWDGPSDRRILQSSGPFTMALGDTQEIVVGVVGGLGNDYLESVTKMKENDRYVQYMYNTLFKSVPPTMSASVSYPNGTEASVFVKAIASVGQFNTITVSVNGSQLQLFDDGAHSDDGANDGTYANTITIQRSELPFGIDVSFLDADNVSYSIPKLIERITTAGEVPVIGTQVVFDNINNDGVVNNGEYVNFIFTVKNNTAFSLSGVKALVTTETEFGKEYTFGTLSSSAEMSIPSTSPFTFRLPINYSDANYKINVKLTDDKGNVWNSEILFPVVQQNFIADSLSNIATNVIGDNDGQVGFVLYDKSIAGNKYDIWYGGSTTLRNWTVVKPIDGTDYATVTATMNALKQVPPINNLPNAKGSGTFTINDAKTQVSYSISVEGLSGAITASHIHIGAAGSNGGVVHPITFTGSTANGIWNIPDSLVDEFTAGNLYVNVHTAANSGGEIRGQIGDGLIARQPLPSPSFPFQSIFNYIENRLIGFSLFIGPAPIGRKSVMQTAPTLENVFNQPNTQGIYRIIDSTNLTLLGSFSSQKITEDNIKIVFNNEVNWAYGIPYIIPSPTPAISYPMKVPFAVYKDTTRVWPIILDRARDSVWNTEANGLWSGKKMFDRVYGIADDKDGSNNDLSYYSPTNTTFPPTSVVIKGRHINSVNHIMSNLFFISETELGIPPQSGTTILFESNKSVKIGDIKTLTLTPTSVIASQISSVPEKFSLSQNYPNPFNPTTRIEFALPFQSNVSIKIYDIIGREVATILNEDKSAGRFMIEWNGKNNLNQQVASGVYFYQMKAGHFMQSKKMLLLK